jgi:cytochrome c553
MKNEYHQKIALLEKEKRQLMKQKDESGMVEKSKFVNKIENLEGELKEYRKKAKEQKNMERQVESQSSKIRDLAEEIKRFKMQKMELHRKLKEDKDQFEKLKSKRVKELLQAKK